MTYIARFDYIDIYLQNRLIFDLYLVFLICKLQIKFHILFLPFNGHSSWKIQNLHENRPSMHEARASPYSQSRARSIVYVGVFPISSEKEYFIF